METLPKMPMKHLPRTPSPAKLIPGNKIPDLMGISKRSKSTTVLHDASHDDGQGDKANALYITRSFLANLLQTDNLAVVKILDLNVSKQWKRKIQYFENLSELKSLEQLNVSGNSIQKIQNLEHLLNLRKLDLSENQINLLEGLESLTQLQVLHVNGNNIASVPGWVAKKLKNLRSINIAGNKICSLHEILKLKHLPNLTELDVRDNPLCSLRHYREYIIFHIRSLELLDGMAISAEERNRADERFSQDELVSLEKNYSELQAEFSSLQLLKESLDEENLRQRADQAKLRGLVKELKEKLDAVNEERIMQEKLLESKNAELSKACEKQYKLEQELAFHKLEAKFDEFWHYQPYAQQETEYDVYRDTGEATYIGKANFKANKYAVEGTILLSQEQQARFNKFLDQLDPQCLLHEEVKQVLQKVYGVSVGSVQDELNHWQEKLKEADARLAEQGSLVDQLEAKQSECKSLRKALDEARKLLKKSRVEKERGALRSAKQDGNSDLNRATEKLQRELEELKGKYFFEKQESEKLKRAYDKLLADSDFAGRGSENVLSLTNELRREREKMKDLKKQIEELTGSLASRHGELNAAIKQRDDLQTDMLRLQSELSKEQNNRKTLLDILNKERLQNSISGEEMRNEVNKMKARLQSSKLDSIPCGLLTDYVQTVSHDVAARLMITAPENVLGDFTPVADAFRSLIGSIDAVVKHEKEENSKMRGELEMVLEQLQKAEDWASTADAKNRKLTENLDLKESDNRILSHANSRLKDELQKQAHEADKMMSEMVGEFQEITEQLKEQLEECENENKKLRANLTKLENEVKTGNRENKTLTKELEACKDTVNKLLSRLAQSKQERKQLLCAHTEAVTQCGRYDNELRSVSALIDEAQKSAANMELSYEQQIEQALEGVDQLEAVLQRLGDKVQCAPVHQNIDGLIADVAELKGALPALLDQAKRKDEEVEQGRLKSSRSLAEAVDQVDSLKASVFKDASKDNKHDLAVTVKSSDPGHCHCSCHGQIATLHEGQKPLAPSVCRSCIASIPSCGRSSTRIDVHHHVHGVLDKAAQVTDESGIVDGGADSFSPERRCEVPRHAAMDEDIKLLNKMLLERSYSTLDKSRDDLRWELAKLEAKVGDSMLRSSMQRRFNRYMSKSYVDEE